MTSGFAAINHRGEILVNTVNETRRAAMVNWLVTELQFLVTLNHTDEMIEELFRRNAAQRGLALIEPVTISLQEQRSAE